MAILKHNKLNYLMKIAERGYVLTAPWLRQQGYSPSLIKSYCDHGWLISIGRGAYLRVGDVLSWEGAVRALQEQLGMKLHVGATSALEIWGISHFATLNEKAKKYFLLTPRFQLLPKWFVDNFADKTIYVQQKLFKDPKVGLRTRGFTESSSVFLTSSIAARAVLETLALVSEQVSFEQAYHLVEGCHLLPPDEMQVLLEKCLSIKAKRLFLYLAEETGLKVLSRLNIEKIELGKGKRVIGGGGHYNAKYQLSVPPLNDGNNLEDTVYV